MFVRWLRPVDVMWCLFSGICGGLLLWAFAGGRVGLLVGNNAVDAGLRMNVMNLPGINGDALFGTVAGTNTRTTGCPFYAVRPGMNIISIPSGHLTMLTRVFNSGHVLPTTVHFMSVTNLMRNTSGNRNLNGGFLDRVHRMSTVTRIVHYFSSPGVARISNSVSPVHSVRVVGARLYLTSLRSMRGHGRHVRGVTGSNSGSTHTRLPLLRHVVRNLNRTGPIHTRNLRRRRLRVVGRLALLATGPSLCMTGVSRSRMSSCSTGRCMGHMRRCTGGRNTNVIIISTHVRSRVTRLSRRRSTTFLRSLNLRRSNLAGLVGTDCTLLNLVGCFATNRVRTHT